MRRSFYRAKLQEIVERAMRKWTIPSALLLLCLLCLLPDQGMQCYSLSMSSPNFRVSRTMKLGLCSIEVFFFFHIFGGLVSAVCDGSCCTVVCFSCLWIFNLVFRILHRAVSRSILPCISLRKMRVKKWRSMKIVSLYFSKTVSKKKSEC